MTHQSTYHKRDDEKIEIADKNIEVLKKNENATGMNTIDEVYVLNLLR